MITFTDRGLCVGDTDWVSACPDSAGILVRFEKGGSVWLSRVFLAHVQDILRSHDEFAAALSESEGRDP